MSEQLVIAPRAYRGYPAKTSKSEQRFYSYGPYSLWLTMPYNWCIDYGWLSLAESLPNITVILVRESSVVLTYGGTTLQTKNRGKASTTLLTRRLPSILKYCSLQLVENALTRQSSSWWLAPGPWKCYLQKIAFDFNENWNETSLGTSEALLEVSRWGIFLGFWRIFQVFFWCFRKIAKNPKKKSPPGNIEKWFRCT